MSRSERIAVRCFAPLPCSGREPSCENGRPCRTRRCSLSFSLRQVWIILISFGAGAAIVKLVRHCLPSSLRRQKSVASTGRSVSSLLEMHFAATASSGSLRNRGGDHHQLNQQKGAIGTISTTICSDLLAVVFVSFQLLHENIWNGLPACPPRFRFTALP